MYIVYTCQTFVKMVKNCKYLGIETSHNLKWKWSHKTCNKPIKKNNVYIVKIRTVILELKKIRVVLLQ